LRSVGSRIKEFDKLLSHKKSERLVFLAFQVENQKAQRVKEAK